MIYPKTRGRSAGSLTVFSICLALLLTACSGGAGTTVNTTGAGAMSCSSSSCGSAMLTLTDAKGDFLSYIVSLTSLQLQTASGASVETLPATTKIDFAKLVDLTEVLSAGQIPAAEYVSAKLTLNYSGANITADDGTGTAVALNPVDSSGNPLTGSLTVSVKLDNANHLVITPGRTGRLAFDFNLAASNTVDLTKDTVTVSPTLVATVAPSDTKPMRVRGQLVSASAAQNDFVLNVHPFDDEDDKSDNGQVTVQVSSTTTYQINGTAYVGSAGITALAALAANTMVAAFGTVQTGTQNFTATSVLAGTSLENPSADQISGTVIARTMTALTVRGATWRHRDGDFDFERHDVSVTVGTNTAVTEEGATGAFTSGDISVGQHVDVFGTAGTDSMGNMTLDASAGQVRLDLTSAWGVVTAMATGSLTVNLQSLDGLPASVFNFAGTGTSTANDATASAYVINTGALDQTGLATGAPARVIGFVTPFTMAPPDFTAQTLVNYSAVTDALVIDWGDAGSATALTGFSASSTSLQPSLTKVGERHFIQIGPQRIDITTLAAAPSIAPDMTAMTDVFTIGHADSDDADNFNTFASFATALAGDLTGSTTVIAVAAAGHYDSTTNVFTATRIAVLLSH